jgi:RimJ/RimL family protein N-acetyltransferase
MTISLPIETERLLIRPFNTDADVEAMAPVFLDPIVMRYIPGGALPDSAGVKAMLGHYADEQNERGFTFWAIVELATDEVVGEVGLGIFEQTGDVELGWTLARDRWGRGYATEAAGACLATGLANLDVPRIIAVVDAENERSKRVAERLGMRFVEGLEAFGRPEVLYEARR